MANWEVILSFLFVVTVAVGVGIWYATSQPPGPSAQPPGPSAQPPGPSAQPPGPSAQPPGPSTNIFAGYW
jgi:hypothetical protein